jgi:hypothetical protein
MDADPGSGRLALEGSGVVVNLVGASIGALWTGRQRRAILESRLGSVSWLGQALSQCMSPPSVWVQASAIGLYGARTEQEPCDETTPPGGGFLASVVEAWERQARQALPSGVRLILLRSGLVLGIQGGLYPRLRSLWRWGGGAQLGSGVQGFSWIHVYDEIKAIRFLISRSQLAGEFNLVSPQAVSQGQWADTLARTLQRPRLWRVPAALLRCLPGGQGQELFLDGQWVQPKRLLEAGFIFSYPELGNALRHLESHEP